MAFRDENESKLFFFFVCSVFFLFNVNNRREVMGGGIVGKDRKWLRDEKETVIRGTIGIRGKEWLRGS